MIVIVCGLPGSGKSYFASLLASRIKAVYINSDRVRKKLFGHSEYTEEQKLQVYEEMLRQLMEVLKSKKNAVLDATFYKAAFRKKFMDAIHGMDQYFLIEMKAKQRLIRKRVAQPRAYSEADFKVFKEIKDQWEPIRENHLTLNSTDDNIENMLLETIRYLQLHGRKTNQ